VAKLTEKSSDEMRSQRLQDFKTRAGAMPLGAGGEIVTIHPLADEPELVSRLGITPEECTSVDGYWCIGEDVVFLQLGTAKGNLREPGLYARLASYPPRHVNLVVVVDTPYITRAVLEKAARDLLHVGWGHAQLREKLIKLDSG
jgi:hypothetical protein